jgi:hypothetical protein
MVARSIIIDLGGEVRSLEHLKCDIKTATKDKEVLFGSCTSTLKALISLHNVSIKCAFLVSMETGHIVQFVKTDIWKFGFIYQLPSEADILEEAYTISYDLLKQASAK